MSEPATIIKLMVYDSLSYANDRQINKRLEDQLILQAAIAPLMVGNVIQIEKPYVIKKIVYERDGKISLYVREERA